MATYREIASMVLDELRTQSDDSLFNEEHVKFLTNKYRALLLKREYLFRKLFKLIPIQYYTPICVDLEQYNEFDNDACSTTYLRSTQPIPKFIEATTPMISSMDFFDGEITYVTPQRFKYTGFNKWLKPIIYATIAPDGYLYIKGTNPQFAYLQKVKMSAIFQDPSESLAFRCDNDGDSACGGLDVDIAIEDALVPELIQSIVRELSGALYRPKDFDNNAKDDLANAPTVEKNVR